VLYEEHPRVVMTVIPRERLRLTKSAVSENQTIRADPRQELLEVEEETLVLTSSLRY
jgi:stress response protein YsnF